MSKKSTYAVTLLDPSHEDGETTHTVTITHQDRLRAEQVGARMGLPNLADAPLTGTTLWAWAALRRLQVLDDKHRPETFLNTTCLDVIPAKDDDESGDQDGGAGAVDPTDPAALTASP